MDMGKVSVHSLLALISEKGSAAAAAAEIGVSRAAVCKRFASLPAGHEIREQYKMLVSVGRTRIYPPGLEGDRARKREWARRNRIKG